MMETKAAVMQKNKFWDKLPSVWDSNKEEFLLCTHIRTETHDVKSFFFTAEDQRIILFNPGQFITIQIEINNEIINRCYTISSSPTRPYSISITVKRKTGGLVSNWLHNHLKVGDKIAVLPPTGDFSNVFHPAKKYVFLSAGSGITPLMSMTRAHYDLSDDNDIIFIHSARTPDDIIFERELELIAYNQKKIQTHFICEQQGLRQNWPGPMGLLSLQTLKTLVPDLNEREAFVCGPSPYMESIREMLEELGFDKKKYHDELFSFEDLTSPNADNCALNESNAGINEFSVSFNKSNRHISCQSQQFILEAARLANVRLASSCTQGVCGTCKVKLLSGQVEMKHNGGIRQREIDQGMILLCCSKPLTDLMIDR